MQKKSALNGVNLGGWLIIEKWMTPSLFKGLKGTNEYDLSQTEEGRRRIRKHHKEFITETDIAWLKDHDIEIVRIPFGYWIFGDDAEYVKAIDRLDWAVTTAEKYGLKVLLDLHAAPEAQNSYDHSGSGNRIRNTDWLDNAEAKRRTITYLEMIAMRYYSASNIWGIELLNEPATDLLGLKLAWFYRTAYLALCKVARPGTRIIFSDAYAPILLTNTFWLMTKKDYPVAMDSHLYQTFSRRDKKRKLEHQLKRAINRKRFIRFFSFMQPLIVGEWSGVLPYKVDSKQTDEYVSRQTKAYQRAEACFYWNYKTETTDAWNFRYMTEKLKTA